MNLLKRVFGKKEAAEALTLDPGFTEGAIYEIKGYGRLVARALENHSGWVLLTVKTNESDTEKPAFLVTRFEPSILHLEETGGPVCPANLTLKEISLVAGQTD